MKAILLCSLAFQPGTPVELSRFPGPEAVKIAFMENDAVDRFLRDCKAYHPWLAPRIDHYLGINGTIKEAWRLLDYAHYYRDNPAVCRYYLDRLWEQIGPGHFSRAEMPAGGLTCLLPEIN